MLCAALVPMSGSAANLVKASADPDDEYYFDAGAEYWAYDVWIMQGRQVLVNTLFKDGTFWGDQKLLEGTSPGNEIYKFEVRNSKDPDDYIAYSSFCAHYGSADLGGLSSPYVSGVLDPTVKANIISALNYIYDTWGSVDGWVEDQWVHYVTELTPENATRVISQIVIWLYLDDSIDTITAIRGAGSGQDYGFVNPLVQEVLDAVAAGYVGEGAISDIAFIVGLNWPGDQIVTQPQIIPLYGKPKTKIEEYGNLVLGKDMGKKTSISGSITGGYASEAVPTIGKNGKETWDHTTYAHSLVKKLGENSNNWFQYNGAMDFTAQNSYTFDLVQGDKLNKVGEYTITYNGGTNFTITFNDAMACIGAKMSISNNIQFFKNKNDKGFNETYIWTTSPGQQQFSFGGDAFTFNAPWVTDLTKVNVYLHLDGLQGYENTYGLPAGTTFDVKVTGPSYPDGEIFQVPMNGTITLNGLITGEYVIMEVATGWKATYIVNGGSPVAAPSVNVTIVKDTTTTVKIKNEPGQYTGALKATALPVKKVTEEYYEPIYKPIYKPVFEPIYKPIYKPVYNAVYKPVYEPVYAPIYAPIYEPVYEPIYKTGGPDTLVSWINTDLPAGVEGGAFSNGMTYLKITISELENNSATIGVALSNPNNDPGKPWNTFVGSFYNLEVDNGVLKFSKGDNYNVEGNYGIVVSNTLWGYNPTSDIKHNNPTSVALPGGDVFYLFFHVDKGKWTDTSTVIGQKWIRDEFVGYDYDDIIGYDYDDIIGWEEVGEEFDYWEFSHWEQIGEIIVGWKIVDWVQIGQIIVGWELVDTNVYYAEVDPEEYVLSYTVVDSNGVTLRGIDDPLPIGETISGLVPGDYTLTLLANGEPTAYVYTKTVAAGQTAEMQWGGVIVFEELVKIYTK